MHLNADSPAARRAEARCLKLWETTSAAHFAAAGAMQFARLSFHGWALAVAASLVAHPLIGVAKGKRTKPALTKPGILMS